MGKSIISDVFENEYNNFKRYLSARFNQLNEYDAEDIIQQTVLKLLYKGNDALSIQNMTSYMYTAIKHGAIDHMRKRQHEVLNAEYAQIETQTVEDEILHAELKKVLKAAIDALDVQSKYIFIETEIKGRSYKALASQTGEKLGTLLSRKSRAMKKLSNIIREYVYKEAQNENI